MSAQPKTETQVQDVMTRDVMRVGPLTSVGEALNMMHDGKVSALPVVDEGDRCFGIVTATDLIVLLRSTEQAVKNDFGEADDGPRAIKLVQQRLDRDPVRNIMSEIMVTVAPDLSIQRAAKTMSDENVHHLPVVSDRKLVGFLSSMDVVRALATTEDEP